jgi:hypothetical protein
MAQYDDDVASRWCAILLMWHFKMPREQKVTFQGSVGKRSLHIQTTIGNMLRIYWEHVTNVMGTLSN